MLSVPTLWIVFTSNFLALALVWAYVMRAYPNFLAARFWTAAAFVAALGGAFGLLRGVVHPLIPILLGNGLMVLGFSLAAMGIRRFYGAPLRPLMHALIAAITVLGLALFTVWRDDMPVRMVIYSIGHSLPVLLTLPLMLSRQHIDHPGARMAGYVTVLMFAAHALRSISALMQIGGGVTLTDFNAFQAAMLLGLVFLSMAWNFGFLLMAIDRLRAEVADLALLDDLTGVANRRHLLRKLQEECALAERTQKPFALLAIDLDGFKEINDGHGHAAGDACLQHFTLMVQSRLRPGDLLARTGGDEFCVVLPATTLQEGAAIARRVLDACRDDAAGCAGADIAIAASIGVAEWSPAIGPHHQRLVSEADQALYAAKNDGKNCFAIYEPAPPLIPGLPIHNQNASDPALSLVPASDCAMPAHDAIHQQG